MIKIIVLVVLLGAAAFFVPPFLEGTSNVCAAFEQKIGKLVAAEVTKLPPALANDPKVTAMLNALRNTAGTANGLLAETYIRDQFPQLPPVAGCAAAYWKVAFDPDLAQYAKGRLPL